MISENLENELNAAIIKDFCTKNAFADYDAVNLEAMAHETIVHTVMNCRTTATQEYKVTDKVVQQFDAYDFAKDCNWVSSNASFYADTALNGRLLREGFSITNPIFSSKFFRPMYEKVFFCSRLNMGQTCKESMVLLVVGLLHILGKKTAKYEIQSDEVAPHREGLKQATFSASKDSPWPPVYFALLGLLGDPEDHEDHEEDDNVNLLDYITNDGDAIDWDTAVSDFVKFMKSSPTYKPAIGKRKRSEAQFLHFQGFSDDNCVVCNAYVYHKHVPEDYMNVWLLLTHQHIHTQHVPGQATFNFSLCHSTCLLTC
ncbi:hypothetical protein MUCCIDRAFT_108643 [Mucor lusitanicus CBS 277.49]|uniref:Uncharacterized protein n=1 Tax=Mucor lusitanicus CBS 277.49 TaxID=747725 RepID=A0A168MEH8_MUCCL|nr:hypothetical protein MUCCIDRAFT_108643 [Mucor lusitanicus CBS 277.49]